MMISVRFVCLCGFGYWILWFHAWCSSMPDFTYLFCSWWVSVHCYPSICFIYGVHHLMSDCNFEATGMVPEQTKEATRPKWDGEWCLHHASKAVFGLLSPWPLTFLLQLICCDTVGKYFVWLKGFLQPILATCDLNLWPPDPRSWSFHALAACTTRANLHQYWFIRFQNIAFTSLLMDHGYYKWLHSTNVLNNNNNNNEDHKYSSLTAGARHVKPRRTTHCTVLPFSLELHHSRAIAYLFWQFHGSANNYNHNVGNNQSYEHRKQKTLPSWFMMMKCKYVPVDLSKLEVHSVEHMYLR